MRARVAACALLAAGALAGCGSSVSAAVATQRWASAGDFPQAVRDLIRDGTNVHRAILRDTSAADVRTACLELFQDANGENTDLLPSPDPQLTGLLSATYDTYIHAAAECDEHPSSPSALRLVQRELLAGFGELVAAAYREQAVSRTALHVAGIP